jgi:transcriptional regulator with XRE-family HTH domain
MKIGSLIKKIRMMKGLTQVQLAEKVGITQNYMSLIETDTKMPSNEKIKAFAKHLNISEEAIQFLSTEPPDELESDDKKKYVKLQNNILSLILFELSGKLDFKVA